MAKKVVFNEAKEKLEFPLPVVAVSRIISKHSFKFYKPVWKSSKKSLTIPGRTLTLRQIADRFANGLNAIDEKVALYDDGRVVIKDFEKLDLTERMEIVQASEERMRQIIHDRQLSAKTKRDAEFAKLVEKAVADKLAAVPVVQPVV